AAIDIDDLAGDVGGTRRGEEGDGLRHVLGAAEAAQGDGAADLVDRRGADVAALEQAARHPVAEDPRADAVGTDAEAALLGADRPGDALARRLRAAGEAVAEREAAVGDGGDGDDRAAALA